MGIALFVSYSFKAKVAGEVAEAAVAISITLPTIKTFFLFFFKTLGYVEKSRGGGYTCMMWSLADVEPEKGKLSCSKR